MDHKELIALCKSIEITKEDAHFNGDNPPEDILSPGNLHYLQHALVEINLQEFFDQINSIEKDKKTLRNDFKIIISNLLDEDTKSLPSCEELFILHTLHSKYGLSTVEPSMWLMSFPDVLQVEFDKFPERKFIMNFIGYTNFKMRYCNSYLFALLPKGKKYGGFLKALLHSMFLNEHLPLLTHGNERLLAWCRVSYNMGLTHQEERSKFFEKFNLKAKDLALWSRIFNSYYPEYADVHKFFGQKA